MQHDGKVKPLRSRYAPLSTHATLATADHREQTARRRPSIRKKNGDQGSDVRRFRQHCVFEKVQPHA